MDWKRQMDARLFYQIKNRIRFQMIWTEWIFVCVLLLLLMIHVSKIYVRNAVIAIVCCYSIEIGTEKEMICFESKGE